MTAISDLKKSGSISIPGGKITREGNKSAIYEASQKIKVTLPLDAATLESAVSEQPMVVLLQSLTGLNFEEIARKVAFLTPRELQVFGEMGMGLKNRKIAENLGISTKTLDIHRANIGRKMGLKAANAFGRAYWFFRICQEFYPDALEKFRDSNEVVE